jgi:hypothetical protein
VGLNEDPDELEAKQDDDGKERGKFKNNDI